VIDPSDDAFTPSSSYSEHASRVVETRLRAGAKTEPPEDKFWNKQLARELFAEMLGTAMIVGLGTGAVMSAIFTGSLVGLFQVASVWIIAVTLAIATTGPVSGAQLNPAISVAFAMLRPKSFAWNKVVPYCAAQLVGAFVASGTNLFLYATKIQEFEKINAIARGTAASIASAKAFGQYFE
jgi:glycerol uptake facilitator-like aquaporin